MAEEEDLAEEDSCIDKTLEEIFSLAEEGKMMKGKGRERIVNELKVH